MKKTTMWLCGVMGTVVLASQAWGQADAGEDRPPAPRQGDEARGEHGKRRPDAGRRGGRLKDHAMAADKRESLLARIITSPHLAKELELNEDQVARLQAAMKDIRHELVDLKADLEQAAMEQGRLLMAETVDEQAILDAVQRTGEIRTEIAKRSIRPLILMKQTLTPEQLQKARQMMHRRMREARDGDGEHQERGRKPEKVRNRQRPGPAEGEGEGAE